MLATGFPFDSVQMPLNAFDANFHSFEQQVLPELNRRGIAALGLRYAMSLPVAVHQRGRFPERSASESQSRARISAFQRCRNANDPRRVPI